MIWKHLLKQLLTGIIYSEYPSPVKFLHSGSLMQPTANLNSVVQDTNLSAPRSLQIVNCFTTVDPTGFPHSKNASIVVRLSGLLKPILSKPVETEKIHPDTGNGACVKAAVGHKPVPDSVWSRLKKRWLRLANSLSRDRAVWNLQLSKGAMTMCPSHENRYIVFLVQVR